MYNKKVFIILFIVLLVYLVLMYLLFGNKDKDSLNFKYIVLDDNIQLEYNNESYYRINSDDINKLKINFDTYVNNSDFGNYRLEKVGSWNLFDSSNNIKIYDGYLLAINENSNVKVFDNNYREINSNEKEYIKDKYNISNFDFLINNQVYDIDLDNNGVLDQIICITNSYYYSLSDIELSDYSLDKYEYSLVFVIMNNNQYNTIIKEIGKNDLNLYSLKGIYKSKKYNIILERTSNLFGDNKIVKDNIYSFDKNKFSKVVYKLKN